MMMKQYGIDPRLVIWIQRNIGHDLQTFSDLAKIKYLDSRKRNFSAARKIDNIRLPSWLVVKNGDFSLIGEMVKLKQLCLHDVAIDDYSFLTGCKALDTLDLQDTDFSDCRLLAELPTLKKAILPAYSQLKHTEVLEQLSCSKEIKEEEKKEGSKEAEQPWAETNGSAGQLASSGPLQLGDTAHLSIDGMGIVLFSAEVMESVVPGSDFLAEEFTDPQQVGAHVRKGDITAFCTGTGGDFALWFRSGYPDSNAEKEFPVMIRLALEVRGGSLQFCDLFWLSDWNTDFPQDQVLSLPDGYYHITACTRRPESGYWGDDQIICLFFNKLEEMPELAWNGVPCLFTERDAETQETGVQEPDRTDYMEMIRQLYGVEEPQGYTEEEIAIVKKYFDPIPQALEEFWRRAARTEAIHHVQDQWIKPEDFDKRDWLRDSDYLIILNENQGCCQAGIRRRDLTKADPPVYVTADDQKWTLCAGTVSGFLQAALAYEAIFAFPFRGEDLIYWLTEDELETVQSGLEKQPFGLYSWLERDMSFYSNASDNMAVIMDCGDLELLYGAASEAGYEKLMGVLEGIGEAL